jgi:hypothetical protein
LAKQVTEAASKKLSLGVALAAEGVEIFLTPDPGIDWNDTDGSLRRAEAEMTFHLEQGLRVGYRGFSDFAA